MKKSNPSEEELYPLIYEVVRSIPKGRITSYGAIANALGLKSGARMIGHAMFKCADAKPPIPAHRVVNSKGELTGKHHFNPPEKMEQLLTKDGVKVINNRVVDFNKLFWDPVIEIQ